MPHAIRKTEEFLTEDENFRVSANGDLETADKILVAREDLPAFMAWLSREFQATTEYDGNG
jgi:hypothetical protein